MIRRPKQGDPINETSGNSKWLGGLWDAAHRQPVREPRSKHRNRFVSALTMLLEGSTARERGDTVTSNIKTDSEDHYTIDRVARIQEGGESAGLFWPMAEPTAQNSYGHVYTHGVFPMDVSMLHELHEFADVELTGAVQSRRVISCVNGAARILDRESPEQTFDDEAARLAFAVTQEHIDRETLFAEQVSTNRKTYWRASGTPAAVVWTESPVHCLCEKPAFQHVGIQHGSQINVEADYVTGNRTIRPEFQYGPNGDDGLFGQMLYTDADGSTPLIKSICPAEYWFEMSVKIIVSGSSTGLEGEFLLRDFFGDSVTHFAYANITDSHPVTIRVCGSAYLSRDDSIAPLLRIDNGSTVKVDRFDLFAHPVRRVQA